MAVAQRGHAPDGVADVLRREAAQVLYGMLSHAVQKGLSRIHTNCGIRPKHVCLHASECCVGTKSKMQVYDVNQAAASTSS